MAITDFFLSYPASGAPADRLRAASLALKSDLNGRALSISTGKSKQVRKVKNLGKTTSPCDWYEAEDRTIPSVSSF